MLKVIQLTDRIILFISDSPTIQFYITILKYKYWIDIDVAFLKKIISLRIMKAVFRYL